MTYEQAIEMLELAKAEVEWTYPVDYQIALDMAMEALEKQKPKKPDAQQTAKNDCWDCPTCGSLTKDMWSHSHDWDNGYSAGHKDGYQQGRKDAIEPIEKELVHWEDCILAESPTGFHDVKEYSADDMQRMICRTIRECKEAIEEQIKEQSK